MAARRPTIASRDLIAELKARGLKITLYPFLMMDIPAGNGLPDPWTGAGSQPAYPWRGHITCDPAPGQSGSPDGTAAAATQVDAFFGIGAPDGWNFRRMVLHYAQLAADAGGVDAFLIGSELRSLTRVRSASGVYPAVTRLAELAADVKAIVGGSTDRHLWRRLDRIRRARRRSGGTAKCAFRSIALWSSSSIDAVGIDYYAPLADWRDTADHLDRAHRELDLRSPIIWRAICAAAKTTTGITPTTRRASRRRARPITDGLGKPWVFRAKDLWSWWGNAHYERVERQRTGSPTGLGRRKASRSGSPRSAARRSTRAPTSRASFPIRNRPTAALPYFSDGARDDFIQRRFLEAVLGDIRSGVGRERRRQSGLLRLWRPHDRRRRAIHLWTWDARPYPVFPPRSTCGATAPNWETGHWLTGRLGARRSMR